MGIVTAEVAFDGRAPDLRHIADKIRELTGLAVSVTGSEAGLKGNLFDQHGYLDFACAPGSQLELHTYRARAVRELHDQTFGDARLPTAKFVKGLNEPPGTQTVYLWGFVGQEPTLLFATQIALEALGGRPLHPIPEEVRREYGRAIHAAELEHRRRKLTKQMRPAVMVMILLLPLLIPLWFAAFVLMMPWRVWKVSQLYHRNREGRGEIGRTKRCT
jgi:hypothetical protein